MAGRVASWLPGRLRWRGRRHEHPAADADGSPGEEVLGPTPGNPEPAATLAEQDAEKGALVNQKARQELGFGKIYAYGALAAMGVQVLIADAGFYIYGYENGWHIPVSAIDVWLAATVIQVIGVVLVIARSLFPSGGSPR